MSVKTCNSCAQNLTPPESVESAQWALVGIIGSSGLGTPERITKLESLKQRKADDDGETVVAYFSS